MRSVRLTREEIQTLIEICEDYLRDDPSDPHLHSALRELLEARYG